MQHVDAYEEALLLQIMNSGRSAMGIGSGAAKATYALTHGLTELEFKYGIYIGRELYSIISRSNSLAYKVNPLLALQDFFGNLDYQLVYAEENGKPAVKAYGKAIGLGFKAHNFEAGMLSGYISLAEKKMLIFNEDRCIENGSDYCMFIASGHLPDSNAAISTQQFIEKAIKGKIAGNAYYSHLLWQPLLSLQYSNGISKLMGNMGIEAAILEKKGKRLEDIIRLLNFGSLKIKSVRPFSATLEFDSCAKEAFANMALAFIDGFLGKKRIYAIATKKSNGINYVFSLKGMKGRK